jgi:ATP synthase protein I
MAEQRSPDRGGDEELSNAAKQLREAEPYLSAIWRLVGSALVGVLGGYLLDRWLGTKPWLLLAFSFLGVSVGFYTFVQAMLRLSKR